ncbi:MAG: hypothetical protein IJV45_00230 [Prevotella sp.]|nr:hypothetical protein [Prevotella sp.]
MNRVCETDAVVKKITVYGNCIDPSQPATATLFRVSSLLLESVTHTLPVFTVGSTHANILVKELYISDDIWNKLESPDKKLMIYHVHNEDHPTHRSLVLISEYLSGNADPYANRFVAYDIDSDVLVLSGSGCFAGMYCYMVVDWAGAWNLFEREGLVDSGEVVLQAVINQEAASNLTLSPTIASYLEKNPQHSALATGFETIRQEIISESIAEPTLPVSTATSAQTKNIFVNSQSALASLQTDINTAVGSGKKCINAIFDGGTYFFSEGLLSLTSGTLTDVELNIIGNGSTLIGSTLQPAVSGYKNGYFEFSGVSGADVYKSVLVNGSGVFVTDFYGPIHEMPKLVELTTNANAANDSENTNVWKTDLDGATPAKMRIPNTIGAALTAFYADNSSELYVQIFLDYFSQVFRVTACTDKYIITEPEELVDAKYTSIEVNKRNTYSSSRILKPCFRLINYPGENGVAYISGGKLYSRQENIRLCNVRNFLTINRSIRALNISGLRFRGNCSGAEDEALINATNATAGWISISDCLFENIRSHVFSAIGCNNILIRRNKLRHYYRRGVSCKVCGNVHVLFNECTDGNLRHDNEGAIICQNAGGHVAYNKLVNYGYMGIGAGQWHGSNTEAVIEEKTIVEYNELYMTPEYRNSLSCVPLLDGGAIYTLTKNIKTIIRYNFISGHAGAMDNRGIFCDDGTYNVWLYGNLVINTKNSYSIDLRKVNNLLAACNSNNRILFNIFDGFYRFEGTENETLTITNTKGCNIILRERNETRKYDKVGNLDSGHMEDDHVVTGCKVEEQSVAVPISMKYWLHAANLPEFIMSHIRYAVL